eukprot:1149890-Pelagomonas_calceolata.AAC.4
MIAKAHVLSVLRERTCKSRPSRSHVHHAHMQGFFQMLCSKLSRCIAPPSQLHVSGHKPENGVMQ